MALSQKNSSRPKFLPCPNFRGKIPTRFRVEMTVVTPMAALSWTHGTLYGATFGGGSGGGGVVFALTP
jgi:uncharacterized repeat protein (TIGR03803 family)